ncbi:hypothetical protein DM01DRAFT_1336835 [Hesseltinella vesiculosa]|uniref:Heme oxygenase-like protein n=1 Tax=Hesseltinella vesiculosa TaxID=101127 RepID=A0A1X2GFC8_9FUNG|nr:hypothetical protein DM01DRAFT_1336835 [Hesseltinella vesiculosa]
MRQGTKAVHAMAEKSVFTKRFLKGDISKSEYGQYIRSLYFIYRAMENLLEQHQDHPAIEMIYFPEDLNREQALLDDLAYFYGPDLVPMLTDPMTMTPAVKQYVHALESACLVDPSLLVSHSYTRYLGDLSGGQILAKRLKKHILQLKKSDSSWHAQEGVSFYYFNTIGNTNEFKNMYRQQLDQVPVTESLKASIVEESIRCFELNIALFDEIQALSEANSLVQLDQVQAIPPPEPSPTASQKRDLPTLSTLSPATTILTSMVILIGCGFYMRQRS